MLFTNKYFVLFFSFFFLMSIELIAQSEKTTVQNKPSITIKASQQPSRNTPTAVKVNFDKKNENEVVEHKALIASQQPSNIVTTATRLSGDNNEEKMVVRKTMTVSQQPSNATPTATKTDTDKKAKLKDK